MNTARTLLGLMIIAVAISANNFANQENPYEDSMEESECYAETGMNCEESAEEWESENPEPEESEDSED